jgi:hypothetical protein
VEHGDEHPRHVGSRRDAPAASGSLASDGRSRGPRDRLDVDGPPLRPHTLTPTVLPAFLDDGRG